MKKLITVSFISLIGFFTSAYSVGDNYIEYMTEQQERSEKIDS